MINKCKICSIKNQDSERNFWDEILFETDNFYAVPSLGSLLEGWILIFSKNHYLSMSELGDDLIDELDNFKNIISNKLSEKFGEITTFEHGPCLEKTVLGCGVDHLHLHLVPLKGLNLLVESRKYNSNINWFPIQNIRLLKDCNVDKGYLFMELPNKKMYLATGELAGSQFFRKVIANDLEIPEKYDWKLYPMLLNIEKTLGKIKESAKDIV